RLRVAVLLDKPERRLAKVRADYVGFTIPNEFVVGYGLDYAERYRNLADVGVLTLGTQGKKRACFCSCKNQPRSSAIRPCYNIELHESDGSTYRHSRCQRCAGVF